MVNLSQTQTGNHSVYNVTLDGMNHEKVLLLLPVIILVIIMMVLGITGNMLVCYIYYFRMKKSPSHYFVLFLASLDLISCCIGMPSELGDLMQPYTFTIPVVCKLLRFVLSFTVISSCIILICVGFDRYYKVCKPFKGFPIRKVKILCLIAMTVGAILSWPALVLYGLKTVETGYPGLVGTECSTADEIKGSVFPLIYYGTLILAFLVTFAIFTLLYARIGIEIRNRRRMTIGEQTSSPAAKDMLKTKDPTTSTVVSEEESISALSDDENNRPQTKRSNSLIQIKEYIVNHFRSSDGNSGNDSQIHLQRNTSIAVAARKRKHDLHTLRTTYIFLAVFVAFLISFVPFLIANILKYSKTAFHSFNSETEEIFYNLCVRSYFISNFINPIIYSLLNQNFRKECRRMLKACCRNRF